MKLYYIPGACSLAAHIVALEADLPVTFHRVDISERGKTVEGEDYTKINPTGLVPLLVLEDGTKLAEAAVIIQYLGSLASGEILVPGEGKEAWKLRETINFLATEVHKSFAPLFSPTLPFEARPVFEGLVKKRLAYVADNLIGPSGYVAGDGFTVADAYLFTLLGWARFQNMDLGFAPKLGEYARRIGARPAAAEALKQEGLEHLR
ncbi:glutathione S-transferase N-terminal domain-containing protein [Xanthobacter autotrophicus]|uniref:glutathione S-transferase N-terminal domain-containing protein n=1 Tax=Xanthobacter autotrophicus TaxID=280 RepID=UPI00372BA962